MNESQTLANIATNLIQLCIDEGLPAPFCKSDVDEIVNDATATEGQRITALLRVKAALHEVVYAPPRK